MRTSFPLRTWRFHLGNDVPMAFYKGFDDAQWQQVVIPHDWSVEYPFDPGCSSGTGYLPGGTGWYRCTFQLPALEENQRVRITFQGVYNNSQVFCNSNNLGKRPYGYSTFSYDLTPFVRPGENQISVKVCHNDLADSRWFTGSGIYRPVVVELYDVHAFSEYGVFAATRFADAHHADLDLHWDARGDQVRFTLLDAEDNAVAVLTAAASKAEGQLHVSAPRLWTAETPYLYTLLSQVLTDGQVTDEVKTRIGIRTAVFDADRGLFVNGISTKLKGVCLHHDAGVLGAAVPADVWRRRLEALQDAGCNAIRTSHNPPAPELLDLCDEMGFYVMDEAFDEWEGCKNKWWQGHNVYPPKHFGYAEDFPQWHEADLSAMVCRDRNHPSILLWSIGNEIDYPNDPYCSELFATMTGNNDASKPAQERVYDPDKPNARRLGQLAQKLTAIVKQHDSSRPVTAALAFPELSNQVGYSDALDVVGYNYKEGYYQQDHARYPGRVLYGSENGHSLENWYAVRDNAFICGQFLWTGIDYMGEAHGWPYRVATPGLLTMAGFPKAGFYQRKALWASAPFAALFTRRIGQNPDGSPIAQEELPCWNYPADARTEVCCYTNAPSAVLYVNGRALERQVQHPDTFGRLCWQIPFEPGTLHIEAGSGIQAARAELFTASAPACLQLRQWKPLRPDQKNPMIQVELTLTDDHGIAVTRDDQPVTWHCENAVFMGCESGAPDDLTAYSSAVRRTWQGRMIAYFRPLEGKNPVISAELNGTRFPVL